MAQRQEAQIVQSCMTLAGFLPGFGPLSLCRSARVTAPSRARLSIALVISVLVHAQVTMSSSSRSQLRASRLQGSETISGTSAERIPIPYSRSVRSSARACEMLVGSSKGGLSRIDVAGPSRGLRRPSRTIRSRAAASPPRLGCHQPGDGHAPVEDLNFAVPPDMAEVTREIGLERGD